MPKKPIERSPVFRRLDMIKASLRKGPREKKVLLHQLRELGKTDFSKCRTYELQNLQTFLERFFFGRTLSRVSGLERTRLAVLNKVSETLIERGIFPKGTVMKTGNWRFDANTLCEKVKEKLSGKGQAALLISGSPRLNPALASALKDILGESAAADFLNWKEKNPSRSFYAWVKARLVKPAKSH